MSKTKLHITINDDKDLNDYLRIKGENHKLYNHYSTSKSLISIIKNNTFRLTRGNLDSLNDHHEFKTKGKESVWNRTYIFCFSYGKNEDMAMLGLYSLPSKEAVRLSLNKPIINLIKNKDKIKIYSDEETRYEIGNNSIEDILITDVFYVKDENKNNQIHRGNIICFPHNNIVSVITSDKATGLVKNYAWHKESEVRLIIRFNKEQRNKDGKLLEYVYLKFPEEVLEKIQIMLGPGFDESYINRIYNLGSKKFHEEHNNKELLKAIDSINYRIKKKNENIKDNNSKIELIKLKKSSFKGLIHFKSDNLVQVIETNPNK